MKNWRKGFISITRNYKLTRGRHLPRLPFLPLIPLLPLLSLSPLLILTGCSDTFVSSLAKQIVKESDPNQGLFGHDQKSQQTDKQTDKQTKVDQSSSENQEPYLERTTAKSSNFNKILQRINNSLPGYGQAKAGILASKVDQLISKNPQYESLQAGSLCNKILIKDATNAVIQDITAKGITMGSSFSMQIKVCAMPEGTPGNKIWIEIWSLNTPAKTISYPLVFAEDGQGGAFFFALAPY